MSMYGKYPKVKDPETGEFVEQKAWPATDFTGDKGFTVQSERKDADINEIIARFNKSGALPPSLRGNPFYGDVSEFGDLQDSYMKIQEAERLFMSYPADVRERFDNNPVEMIDFLSDDANRDEAIKLGLVVPRPPVVETPPPVPGGPPPVTPA